MKWTSRDTTYLTIILALLAWLGFLVTSDIQDHAVRQTTAVSSPARPLAHESSDVELELPDDYVDIDGYQVTEKQVETPAPIIGRVKTIDIDRNAAPEEIARKLGMKVEDLPPSLMKNREATDDK